MDGGRLGRGPTTTRVADICSSDVSGLLRPRIRSEHGPQDQAPANNEAAQRM